jgi:hypothetical protein
MIVALFDSGVDFTHIAFEGESAPFHDVTGFERDELAYIFRKAVFGELSTTELREFAERVPIHAQPRGSGLLLPGRDFAGHHPSLDFAERGESTTNVYDYNGHGTASASLLTGAGHTVLPIKVGYSLAPYISLSGLVAGCEWLLDQRSNGLNCEVALWPFGMTVDNAEEVAFFEELANEMRLHGITIFASGRSVYQDNAAPTQQQVPSDVPSVIGVDEQIVLRKYILDLDSGAQQTCFHLPATPRPPRLDQDLCDLITVTDPSIDTLPHGRVVVLCSAKHLRVCMPLLNSATDGVVVVTEAGTPYLHSPLPYLFDVSVLVTVESIDCDRKAGRITLAPAGMCTVLSTATSRDLRMIGTSGMAVPAAGTHCRWMAAFGASVAGPSAFASCV